jgi:hypothetical protein
MLKRRLHLLGAAAAAVLLSSQIANAQVTLTLTDSSSRAKAGFAATLDGVGTVISGNELIGVYKFTKVPPGDANFWSVCLSPDGQLLAGTHTYDQLTFEAAHSGANPPNWVGTSGNLYGIQNANWLWREYRTTATSKDAGSGLAMAMYAALYNSTAYGQVDTSASAPFQVTTWAGGVGGAAKLNYDTYLAALNAAGSFNTSSGPDSDIYNGYVLRPQPGENVGQDFILIGSPVPEPTTLIAGVLLLLPFGISTLRIYRRNRREG